MIAGVKYRWHQLQQRTGFAMRGASNYAKLMVRSDDSRPKFAAVTVGRNDDYMSDFRERLFATVAWNTKYLVSEFIFVEWNPPADRELLSYELTKKFDSVRAYVVPREIHQQTCQNPNINLLEYHAKNVGIRRARSSWIMSTNADAAVGLDSVNRLLNTRIAGRRAVDGRTLGHSVAREWTNSDWVLGKSSLPPRQSVRVVGYGRVLSCEPDALASRAGIRRTDGQASLWLRHSRHCPDGGPRRQYQARRHVCFT